MLQDSFNVKPKKRHGCLTAYLVLLIVGNSLTMFFIPIAATSPNTDFSMPGWFIVAEVIFSIFDIVCAFALFGWRKWGFWGLCASNVIAFVVSLVLGELLILGILNLVVSIGVMVWVLHIGKDDKGWPQLE